ncbi:MAG TPA: glycerol-3-phosphate dehydrogenase [Alphaproteobacteria bacterium]|nr:glycerol-3-phosphate dehydrogenase [Alphaproteobacteria bacterium]
MNAYDLLVIGAGVNGAGIARDAAGRGLKVLVIDKGDPGGATSSASSKLIHGGLRYLGYYEFGLVRESLAERARLLRAAPHIAWPLDFVLPWRPGLRPRWMIRLGLMLYDVLGAAELKNSHRVDLRERPWGAGLAPRFTQGFVYSDGWVDDARLVILTLRAAGVHGATVQPHTAIVAALREGPLWRVSLQGTNTEHKEQIAARAIINVAGPWAEDVARDVFKLEFDGGLRLVQGSHIVVPRVHDGDHALILQNPDERVIFILPFERDFSMIGTTEVTLDDMGHAPAASGSEIDYLCRTASEYLAKPIAPDDVRWSFAGVRPLFDDGSTQAKAVSRDYKLFVDGDLPARAPVVTVFGGKLTTHRKLAEKVVNRIIPWFPRKGGPWTDTAVLPGGDMPDHDFALYLAGLARSFDWLPAEHLHGLARRHGSLTPALLEGAGSPKDMGLHFGAGLYERELAWFAEKEWARAADDVLWRRTKMGLHLDAAEREAVSDWIARVV